MVSGDEVIIWGEDCAMTMDAFLRHLADAISAKAICLNFLLTPPL